MYLQGRQSVPKSCRSEREGKGISGLFLPLTGAFYFEFLGRGRKSGSGYALVDLVTLAPLLIQKDLSNKIMIIFHSG